MARRVDRILKLEVPVIVRLGERDMKLGDVISLIPGAILELPKSADDELELLINNKVVGTGRAVKVGENFGIRITYVGDVRQRVEALGETGDAPAPAGDDDAEALAEALLAGQ